MSEIFDTPEWARDAVEIDVVSMPNLSTKTPTPPDEESFEPLTIEGVTFPREASARIRQMSETDRAAWEADRFRAKVDPLFLSQLLGMDLVENPHRMLFAQFPKKQPGTDMSRLDVSTKKRLILWPRGVAKTTSARVEMAQIILNYPNVRICFLTGGDELAKRQLAALKMVFEKPKEKFLRLFPEFCLTSIQNKKTGKWTDVADAMGNAHEFTVPCRTSTVFAEPTFAISTARSVKAGSHFDFIFIDDLVNDQNYRSAKALEKCYQDYLDICPLLEPTGYIVMTGTRYSYGDTYERIQEQAKAAGEATIWKFSIRDCWSTNCKTCGHPDVYHNRDVNILEPPCSETCSCIGFVSDGNRTVLFPQVITTDGRMFGHTLDILEKIKAELGPSFFANQYENKPLADETQTFTETLIGGQTLFEETQLPPFSQAFTFVVGDLAYSVEDERDLSVLYVCRKHQGQIFVVDCLFGHWNSTSRVDNTIAAILKHRPNVLYYEKTLGSDSLNDQIIARATQIGLQKVPIEWIKLSNQKNAKSIRIASIRETLTSKRLWLYRNMPGYEQLVQQLVKWPRTKHDDFADCLGQVVNAPSGYKLENPPQPQTTLNWLRKLNPAETAEESYSDNGAGNGICC